MISINWNKVISMIVFTVVFVMLTNVIDVLVYKILPFQHFVKYSLIERSDVCYGDTTQDLYVERKVRKNVQGTITSELFLVKSDPVHQISEVNIKVFQEKFDIIYDKNETNSELIKVQLPELQVGDYYWIELSTITLPRGVKKSKLLDPQYFSVLDC